MKIKCVIVDDEPLALKVLENYFVNFSDFEIIKSFHNSLEALEFINNSNSLIDVLFLDITMPIMNGFEIIQLIRNKPMLVITTAFREFAAESYDLDVLDYLVKPIPFPRFTKCIHKINDSFDLKKNLKPQKKNSEAHIFIKVDKKMVKLIIDEILFVEGMKEYIKIVTLEKSYITHKSLSSLADEIPANEFLRIHKSFIISIKKINSIEGNRIQIHSFKLPIGRNYVKEVKNKILE